MKIAIDISPISKKSNSSHKVRGVGSYINLLVNNIEKFDKKNSYVFVEDKNFPSNADLIHYPYFDPFFITLPLIKKKKTVVTVHDLTPLVFPKNFPVGVKGSVKWLIQKQSLKNVDLVVGDSMASKNDIEKIVGIKNSKVHVGYLAVSQDFKELRPGPWVSEIQQKYNLPEKFVLYVGDATWNKNLPRLIEAIKKTKYPLILVGKIWGTNLSQIPENPWNDDLRSVLKKIENDPQFLKLGFVPDEDIVKIYNVASVLVMPSVYEGFGLPVLEAMSCGCAVVSSRGGSLPEVGDESVYYVDHKSVDSIAEGVSRVMTDKKLRDNLITKGLERAKFFSVEKTIKELIGIYELQ